MNNKPHPEPEKLLDQEFFEILRTATKEDLQLLAELIRVEQQRAAHHDGRAGK